MVSVAANRPAAFAYVVVPFTGTNMTRADERAECRPDAGQLWRAQCAERRVLLPEGCLRKVARISGIFKIQVVHSERVGQRDATFGLRARSEDACVAECRSVRRTR